MTNRQTWGGIFWKYVRKGHDFSDAAMRADLWLSKQSTILSCTSKHCERSMECRSPHDCSGDFRAASGMDPAKRGKE